MLPIIGHLNTRVNSIDAASEKDEFGEWVHAHNFRAVKTAANSQNTGNNTGNGAENRQPFAILLKQVEQDNNGPQHVELRPRTNNLFSLIDIEA